jgi:NAD(P)-dependent dehydrogenase (short-subunit alcohol dehydrogenase family)
MSLRVFDGAVAIVTGGASGIGKAMAKQLVARGGEVVLADRDIELARATANELGARATPAEVDVTSFEAVESIVGETVRRTGRLDYMFNNAGIGIGGEVAHGSIDVWRRVLGPNLDGVVHGVQAAYPRMVEQGFGHIVNTASVAGLIPTPMMVSYGTSKHAVVGLSRSLRIEAERRGVHVSVLCPGAIRTPIFTGGKYGGMVGPGASMSTEKRVAAWEKVRPMEPDAFAEQAIDAVARNEAIIVLPSWWKILWMLHRISPALGTGISKLAFGDMMKTLNGAAD